MPQTFYTRCGKRLCDIALSSLGLLALSPCLALVAIAVRLTSPGPAFFLQTRTGKFGKSFRIIKFRTMRTGASGSLVTAAGDPRITGLGRWLRKSKIDELPQLFNVLLGHMSLVGPRPEVPLYTEKYTPRQKQVLVAKPGITCPFINIDEEQLLAAQPDKESFYLSTVMPAKLEIDLAYCQNIRFFEDLRLVFSTLVQLWGKLSHAHDSCRINPVSSRSHLDL